MDGNPKNQVGISDASKDTSLGGVEEEVIRGQIDDEITDAHEQLSSIKLKHATVGDIGTKESWDKAVTIVREFRPVPWPIWEVTRSVFGLKEHLGNPHYNVFDRFAYVLKQAYDDPNFLEIGSESLDESVEKLPSIPLEFMVASLGSDVSAALCFIHAVVRKVSARLTRRIRAAIIDEALLRGQIGFHIGKHGAVFGAGRGMLAGFAARSGLAVQFAYGNEAEAERALELLASGVDFHRVGLSIYDCDPLQVSAMTMVAGGCGQDAAYGIAAYSVTQEFKLDHAAFKWLSAFRIAEYLRIAKGEQIQEEHWLALGIMNEAREMVHNSSRDLIRFGHTWQWILSPPNDPTITEQTQPFRQPIIRRK